VSDLGWLAICGCLALAAVAWAHSYHEAEMARDGLVQKQNDRGIILWVKP
jgi:hypothetical protein